MTQMAFRLSAITRQSLLRDQSLLSTCAAGFGGADFDARRWNGHVTPETITELPKYHYVMSINLDGTPPEPSGFVACQWRSCSRTTTTPPVRPTDKAIDANLRRRPGAGS
ncbi:hypothetical protein [Streptomyces sp. NBC_01643]|uniref:hypothetical protein n=1 Tax=Streptomyces sp. NBC_01643 TaxID=2975906 RepID=UPI002F908AC5|nr:hypothetical protein OHB03_48500 [Streptomyces sp. NBC_01643]